MKASTPKSIATRAKLVAVAERLFAERGVDGVSLSEINKASGQRNANACQYHFGTREGLLQAIVDKHVPGIAARRDALLDQLEADNNETIAGLTDALVLPVVEKLHDPEGGDCFIRVNAQLIDRHMLAYFNDGVGELTAPGQARFVATINRVLSGIPRGLRQQRLHFASILLFHGLADHSRLQDKLMGKNEQINEHFVVHTLRDSIYAILAAPHAEQST